MQWPTCGSEAQGCCFWTADQHSPLYSQARSTELTSSESDRVAVAVTDGEGEAACCCSARCEPALPCPFAVAAAASTATARSSKWGCPSFISRARMSRVEVWPQVQWMSRL